MIPKQYSRKTSRKKQKLLGASLLATFLGPCFPFGKKLHSLSGQKARADGALARPRIEVPRLVPAQLLLPRVHGLHAAWTSWSSLAIGSGTQGIRHGTEKKTQLVVVPKGNRQNKGTTPRKTQLVVSLQGIPIRFFAVRIQLSSA